MYTVLFVLGMVACVYPFTSRYMPTDLRIITFLCGVGLIVMSYSQPN